MIHHRRLSEALLHPCESPQIDAFLKWLQREVETKHALFSNLHLALFAWNLDHAHSIPFHQRPSPATWAPVLVSHAL